MIIILVVIFTMDRLRQTMALLSEHHFDMTHEQAKRQGSMKKAIWIVSCGLILYGLSQFLVDALVQKNHEA